jgi:GTP-binding protein
MKRIKKLYCKISNIQFLDKVTCREMSSKMSNRQFLDTVQIECRGGKGGQGCVSWQALSPGKKKPDGGNGGKGGSVYIVGDNNLTSFKFETLHFNGDDGGHGGSSGMTGRNGKDIFVRVPLGTVVTERIDDNLFELMEEEGYDYHKPTFEIEKNGSMVLVADGGKPGQGNASAAGTSTLRSRSLPATKIPGEPGEKKSILLELKTIADVGLVGFPNAGKSTLLRALSNAKPKVAAYPFTTLHPSIGIVEYSDLERITVADIPGLIDGAHMNRGLGHDFLRHIERTKVILYVIDGVGSEGRSPSNDLLSLMKELELYDKEIINPNHTNKILNKPSLVFCNKNDIRIKGKKANIDNLEQVVNDLGFDMLQGSAEKGVGIKELAEKLRYIIESRIKK